VVEKNAEGKNNNTKKKKHNLADKEYDGINCVCDYELKNTKNYYGDFLTLKITGDRHITSFLVDWRDIIGDLFEMSAKVSNMTFVHNLFAN